MLHVPVLHREREILCFKVNALHLTLVIEVQKTASQLTVIKRSRRCCDDSVARSVTRKWQHDEPCSQSQVLPKHTVQVKTETQN